MRLFVRFCFVLVACLLVATPVLAACPVGGRIAVSHDGNMHDLDDITAGAMVVAILAKSGAAPQVVWFGHSDHTWWTDVNREEQMRVSTVETARRFGGFDLSRFFNLVRDASAAQATLVAEINASSPTNRLTILLAGQMEFVGQAINASDPAKRQYVTIVSHSFDNDAHAQGAISPLNEPGASLLVGWTFDEIDANGVQSAHIADGNPLLGLTFPSQWEWLRDSADANLRWLWCRWLGTVCPEFPGFAPGSGQSAFDVSDATLAYWLVSGGDQAGDPQKIQTLLTGGIVTPPPPPPPPPPPSGYTLMVSTSANRSNPVALNGQTLSGTRYIFTAPDTNILRVHFFQDGVAGQTENVAPYDFKGGSVTIANPWFTTTVPNGSHTIQATLVKLDGSSETITATFVIGN